MYVSFWVLTFCTLKLAVLKMKTPKLMEKHVSSNLHSRDAGLPMPKPETLIEEINLTYIFKERYYCTFKTKNK